jgi:hypothetical protein
MAEVKIPEQLRADPPGEIFYHYTSLTAFESIMSSDKMRATDIRYLNDTMEQKVFERHLDKRIKHHLKTTQSPDMQKQLLLWQNRRKRDNRDPIPYVVCFSNDGGDRLSQWRGYAAQGGVSIGFKRSRLVDLRYEPTRFRFRRVQYVNPHGGKASNEIIDTVFGWNSGIGASSTALDWGAFFKHNAFEEEKEWRLVMFHWSENPLQYWIRGSLMVPYLQLDIGGSLDPFVEEVVVGPSAHQKQTAVSIQVFLKLKGWDWVKVRRSKIPYRGW